MALGSLLHRETIGAATPAARPPLPLSQFRAREFRLPAERRWHFFLPLFPGAHESDFPAGPSRSSLRDKIVRSTKLRAWPLADSNPLDPRPSGYFRIARPHRVLQEPVPPCSRGRRRHRQNPLTQVARGKRRESLPRRPLHKPEAYHHPLFTPSLKRFHPQLPP